MSFVEAYQVGSLQWKRDLQVDDYDDGQPGFVELGHPVGSSSSQPAVKLGLTVSAG